MNWNYFKIAWRFILKNRTYTIINILGLGLGFSVSVLMMIFVHHELNYDSFHEKSNRIYRIVLTGSMADGKVLSAALTSGEVAQYIAEEVPGAEEVCRVYNWGISEVVFDEQRFTDDQILWVDSGFFQIFSFHLLKGDPEYVLKEPFSVVITKSTAEKYFRDKDPVNKTIRIRGLDYSVKGIVKDPPSNSHLQFDILASFHSLTRPGYNIVERSGIAFPTYVLKRENADFETFKEKLVKVADYYLNERYEPYGIVANHNLQALDRVYLHSGFDFETSLTGDIRHVYIFSFLALAVFVIAVFNFINLVTVQSEKRMREIGIRKLLGAFRKELIWQFLGESVIITLIAFVVSLMLNELLLAEFSGILEGSLRLEYWHNPHMLLLIIAMVLITGIVAGLYPALYLSGFQPITVLKGLARHSFASQFIRKVLVVFQFSISIFLITSVLLLNRQVVFLQNKNLGFARENVLSIRGLTENIRNAFPVLMAEMLQNPSITYVSASQEVPGENFSFQNSRKSSDPVQASIMIYESRIQHGHLETFGMHIVKGRNFDPLMMTDTSAIIINERAARLLGLDDPVGEEIVIWEHTGKIIGVVANFNYQSLHNEIDPLAFTMYDGYISRINIRMLPQNLTQTMQWIKDRFEAADPNYQFEYFFVDDLFSQMYKREKHISRLTFAAAIIAIIISFMGLFALASFTIQKRIKEIGIRKTLGASMTQILLLLFREMWLWIVIACIIAWPLSAYVISRWLENFHFTINIIYYWYLFIVAGIMASMAGTLAIFFQAWSAGRANPVDSLKIE